MILVALATLFGAACLVHARRVEQHHRRSEEQYRLSVVQRLEAIGAVRTP